VVDIGAVASTCILAAAKVGYEVGKPGLLIPGYWLSRLSRSNIVLERKWYQGYAYGLLEIDPA
jgi:hypothetical protein